MHTRLGGTVGELLEQRWTDEPSAQEDIDDAGTNLEHRPALTRAPAGHSERIFGHPLLCGLELYHPGH